MKTIIREVYLERLRKLKDQHLIKVITGIRRCGKSTLLHLFKQELLDSDIESARITHINFEDPNNSVLVNWMDIYQNISKNFVADKMNYVFLDEVQYIDEFERLLVGLHTKENVDLYVTGSNAKMLSSELATLLTGRAYEIGMLPLSFAEYIAAFKDEPQISLEKRFADFFNFGGLPQAVSIFISDPNLVDAYLEGVYSTIINRDIFSRGKISDPFAFNKIAKYLFDNIGNFNSATNIANVLNNVALKTHPKMMSHHTVENYIGALKDCFLFYSVGRISVKGKERLRTQEKFYATDLGIRQMLLGRQAQADLGHLLENIVYLELLRRGNSVWIGKVGDKEIDFVVQDIKGYTTYYQSSWTTKDAATLKRELAPLKSIKDHSTKILITTDIDEPVYDGIRKVNVINWLLDTSSLRA
jgi:predicted AAA+ superfamily ATPase